MKRSPALKKQRRPGGGTLRFILIVALVAWMVRSMVFAPFSIPSGSMLPTLHVGDYLIVAKWPYGYSRYSFPFQFPPLEGRIFSSLPERGDVVVFVTPDNKEQDYVKRLIGLPGDTVEVRNGRLVLNGRSVTGSRTERIAAAVSPNSPCRTIGTPTIGRNGMCLRAGYRETLPNGASYRVLDQVSGGIGDNYPATKVPAGYVFLMGDNRDDSLDSRFSPAEGGIGFVPLDHLVGRATMVFWSTDGSSSYVKPWTWFSALRTERLGKSLDSGAR